MSLFPLKDADGNPVTCATLDVAGDPDVFSPPVVSKDADGNWIWTDGSVPELAEIPPSGLPGLHTNWDTTARPWDTYEAYVTPTWEFRPSPAGTATSVRNCLTTIDGVEHVALQPMAEGYEDTFAGPAIYPYDVNYMLTRINDYSGEVDPHITMNLASDNYCYASPIPAGDYVLELETKDDIIDTGAHFSGQLLTLTFDLSVVEFDSVALSGTEFAMVNPVVGSTMAMEWTLTGGNNSWFWALTELTSTANYNKIVRNYFPFTLSGDKQWMFTMSNMQINGVPFDDTMTLNDEVGITFKPIVCLPA